MESSDRLISNYIASPFGGGYGRDFIYHLVSDLFGDCEEATHRKPVFNQ
ncbi:hypothetical protein ACE1AT_07065 [Pelatocladus sp. BLCC-F211]